MDDEKINVKSFDGDGKIKGFIGKHAFATICSNGIAQGEIRKDRKQENGESVVRHYRDT